MPCRSRSVYPRLLGPTTYPSAFYARRRFLTCASRLCRQSLAQYVITILDRLAFQGHPSPVAEDPNQTLIMGIKQGFMHPPAHYCFGHHSPCKGEISEKPKNNASLQPTVTIMPFSRQGSSGSQRRTLMSCAGCLTVTTRCLQLPHTA
jgi:hypothetical protein